MPLATKAFSDILSAVGDTNRTYFDASQTLQSALSNALRTDYDPSLYNAALQSNTFTSPWSLFGGVTVVNNALTEGTSPTGGFILVQNVAKLGFTQPWTFGIDVKQNVGTRNISVSTGNSGNTSGVRIIVNPATGAIVFAAGTFGAFSLTGSSVVGPDVDGYYRVTLSMITDGDVVVRPRITLTSGTAEAYAGDGVSSVLIRRAQLNPGAVAITYLETTTTKVSPIKGVLVEPSRTNMIRNSTVANASLVGTYGTGPTNWGIGLGNSNGYTRQIVGVGTINGIPYIDIRYFGTPTSTLGQVLQFEPNNQYPAVQGEIYSFGFFFSLIAGSFTNVSSATTQLRIFDSGFTASQGDLGVINLATLPGGVPLSQQRIVSNNILVTPATTAYSSVIVRFGLTSGLAFDFTIRVGLPQMEKAETLSSPIKSSGSLITRSQETLNFNQISSTLPWINQTGMTFVVEGMIEQLPTPTQKRQVFSLDDGTANNSQACSVTAGSSPLHGISTVGGATQSDIGGSAGNLTKSVPFKFAYTVQKGDARSSLNAGTVQSATPALMTSLLNNLRLGSDAVDSGQVYIRKFKGYRRVVSNSELQAF